ncbi:MAG: hypothetical protein CDV28_1638 [Candidatus Electronema aureum]|uniref:Uncharacterized protein n=1 Tax=Candidatus Electronema aureum TaxID=2005002 RepID=A0A521FYB2_9BACT|nr:MAG: hypothetical protein CDV28_1638 [Candidatus Electronema aureum]
MSARHEFAVVDANGSINQSYSCSERISCSGGGGSGHYLITFGRQYLNPPVVVATLFANAGWIYTIEVNHVDERRCDIKIIDGNKPGSCNFMIHAIGD